VKSANAEGSRSQQNNYGKSLENRASVTAGIKEMKELIFISSAQKELSVERTTIRNFINGDPLLSCFFDVFLFEDIPALDQRKDNVYLDEVRRSSVYLGIFGNEYGIEDKHGLSPTHKEFLAASHANKTRLIYVKGDNDNIRHPKMKSLLRLAGSELIRRRFNTVPELQAAVYSSLVKYLHDTGRLLTGPFDATVARNATLKDISVEKVRWFLARARNARDYALSETTAIKSVLSHLNLLEKGRPTNAAILVFGSMPQRFLISSEVKCMHFHGVKKLKPIPSYQVFKGTVFDLVDKSVDFVMSKLNRTVGTRAHSPQSPVEYDIPQEVVTEGIVNAVAHRNYTSNASVEIMLFSDRLEIWNPGSLPPLLSIKDLGKPHSSQPGNPLLAEPLFLTKYIEKAGTGTIDMYDHCRAAGMRPPKFRIENGFFILSVWRKQSAPAGTQPPTQSTEQVGTKSAPSRHQVGTKLALSEHQVKILRKCSVDSAIRDLMSITGRTDRTKFRNQVLNPLIKDKLIEMTIPERPKSSNQKYRITAKGRSRLAGKSKGKYND